MKKSLITVLCFIMSVILSVTLSSCGGQSSTGMTDNDAGMDNDSRRIISYGDVFEFGGVGSDFTQIKFQMDDIGYTGIVNVKGEIIYYEQGKINWTSIGNGMLYIETDTQYILMDDDGRRVTTFTKNDFDKVIGHGNGRMLVYKNQGTIAVEKHTYGVIDSTGAWEQTLFEHELLPDWNFKHFGEGVFVASRTYNGIIVLNTNTKKAFCLFDCNIYGDAFKNGCIYGYASESSIHRGKISEYAGTSFDGGIIKKSTRELPPYFKLYADGTYQEIEEFKTANQNFLIDASGEYLTVINNGIEYEYKEVPRKQIRDVQIENEYILLKITGADGKNYFTVLNSQANQMFDAKQCDDMRDVSLSNDVVIYGIENTLEAIDINGKNIISRENNYVSIDYEGGLVLHPNKRRQMFVCRRKWRNCSIMY